MAKMVCCLALFCLAILVDVDSKAIPHEQRAAHCRHIYPTVDELPHPILLQNEGIHREKRDSNHHLRVKIFYDESVDNLEPGKTTLVKQVVPEAVAFWEKVLQIPHTVGPIKLNRKCQDNQYFLSENDPNQYCKETCVQTNCGEVAVPKDHLEACRTCNADGLHCDKVEDPGEGVLDADFVLYVSAKATSQCGEIIGVEADTVAYAAHCQQEATLDRPIAGHTNICPQAIINGTKEISALHSTIQHELLHALGFSSSLFAFYRDADGNPRTKREEDGKPPINFQLQVRQWSENTIQQITRPYKVRSGTIDRTFYIMVTPKVVEEVRAHFGCPTLEGAELEDQGGDGTFLTHWEKRLFQNEAMTGTVHTQNPAYTRLTLALLEDSGWYIPNYDMAETINWGKNMGCDFATKSCKELMDLGSTTGPDGVQRPVPFCNTLMTSTTKTACTEDLGSVGNCNLVTYGEDLPKMYQNFDTMEGVTRKDMGKIGGSVSLADFCPYVQEFTWRSEDSRAASRGSQCKDPENNPEADNNFSLENYGEESLCFEQGSAWQQRSCTMLKQFRRFGSGCYKYKCEEGLLNIIISNVTFRCLEKGQVIDIGLKIDNWLHEGSVVCPPCDTICGASLCSQSGKTPEQVSEENQSHKQSITEDCEVASNSLIKDFLDSFKFNVNINED